MNLYQTQHPFLHLIVTHTNNWTPRINSRRANHFERNDWVRMSFLAVLVTASLVLDQHTASVLSTCCGRATVDV